MLRRLITRGERADRAASCDLGAGDGGFAELVMDAHPGVDRRAGRLLRADAAPRRSSGWPAQAGRWEIRARRSRDAAWRDGASGGRALRRGRLAPLHPPPARRAQARALRGGVRPARAGRPLPELGARRDRRARARACSTSSSASGWSRRSSEHDDPRPPRRSCAILRRRGRRRHPARPRDAVRLAARDRVRAGRHVLQAAGAGDLRRRERRRT